MCQVMGYLMRRRLGSRAEAGIPKLLAHPTLDFLRLVLVCRCHAPRASRLGGWDPVTTLCVTPLPRPAEWVAVRPLESRLFSLSGSPISCIEGLQVCRTCLCSGVDRAGLRRWGLPLLPRSRPVVIYPHHTSTSRPP